MKFETRESLPRYLQQALTSQTHERQTEWEARPAAVLIPLYWEEKEWHLLFTRRTDHLETHRGQVSFPGGQIEAQDRGPTEAALRETQEEIGIHPDGITILGQLNPLLTVTQFEIVPIVGTIPWPHPLRINQHEVSRVFGVPISWLADPDNLELRHRGALIPGPRIPVYYYAPFQGEVIWGATARITLALLELLGLRT